MTGLPAGEARHSGNSAVCILAAAALVPWTFSSGLWDSFVLPKLVVACALTAMGAAFAWREGSALRTPLDAPLGLLLALALVSTAAAPDPRSSLIGRHESYAWCLLGWVPCALAFMVSARQSGAFAPRLAAVLTWSSIPVSAYAVAQVAGLDPIFRPQDLYTGHRAASSMGSPVTLGCYLAAVLPAAVHSAGTKERRGLGLVAAVLAGVALWLTGTRAAWLAGLAGCAAYALLMRRSRVGGVVAVATLGAACFLAVAGLSIRRGGSDVERIETWKTAAAIWRERPLLGTGPGGFELAFRPRRSAAYVNVNHGVTTQEDAHNDWLQVLAGMGLLGVAAYGWLHVRLWRLAGRALDPGSSPAERRAAAAALAAGLVSLVVFTKLNTPAWVGVFLAAVLAGGLASCAPAGSGSRRPIARAAPSVAVGLGIGALALSCWFAAADRRERLGRRARHEGRPREAAALLEAACAMRPAELGYRLNLANLLWDVAEAAAPEQRAVLLRRAAEVGAEAARLNPRDAGAHHLLGLAELRRADWGGEPTLDHARRALARALELDPYFPALLKDASRAARMAGDVEGAGRLEDRLSRVLKKL